MKKIFLNAILVILVTIVPAKSESFTLKEFLIKVKDYSDDLKLVKEDLKYAKASKKEAVSSALPYISASADYNRYLNDYYMYINLGNQASKLRANKDNEFGFNVTLNQVLLNGTVFNAIKAAGEYTRLAEFLNQASQNEIMAMAKKIFYQTLLLKEVYEVSIKSEQSALENYTEVNMAFENGLKSEFEKLQAEVRYKEALPQTTAAKRNYELALLNMKNMAGLDPDEILELVGSLQAYPPMPEWITFDEILNQRPDYNAIIWDEKLKATGVKAEKAGHYPSLNGFLTYNYSAQSDQFKFEEENKNYIVGLKLSIPIFSGGLTSARVQKAKIELSKSRLKKNQTVDKIRTDIENIKLRLVESFNRIQSANSVLTTAQKAFEIARSTSEVGLSTQLELKDSRIALDKAKIAYGSAIYEYLDAYFDWEKANGRVPISELLDQGKNL